MNWMRRWMAGFAACAWMAGSLGAAEFDPVAKGAVGDGKRVCRAEIQRAIDEASKAGGGTVAFSKPKFWGKDGKSGMMADYIERGLRWAVDYDCKRIRLIQVYKSKNVLLEGLRLERSGFWTVHLCFSENLICRGLIIRNNVKP